ncbi:hypothetical protein [Frigoriglobus tundricola]|uniref:Uncharacterized protein n=1 Tax=Frigoriglobus tundricola TaxID=2774151 RepID=A0A6M5Z184_9BACT|nr:hypothetical protein [Frigoriglobus tundricola]QJX00080.1 hypothetical protein FTUN_7704 [Frigoriglobus tundricola]
MCQWTEYAPASGWAGFARSDALTGALWDRLPVDAWVYLNLVSDSSMWESRADASVVSCHYAGGRVVHLAATPGAAAAFAAALAAEFGLVVSAEGGADSPAAPSPTDA